MNKTFTVALESGEEVLLLDTPVVSVGEKPVAPELVPLSYSEYAALVDRITGAADNCHQLTSVIHGDNLVIVLGIIMITGDEDRLNGDGMRLTFCDRGDFRHNTGMAEPPKVVFAEVIETAPEGQGLCLGVEMVEGFEELETCGRMFLADIVDQVRKTQKIEGKLRTKVVSRLREAYDEHLNGNPSWAYKSKF